MGKAKRALFMQPSKIALYLLTKKPREFMIYCYLLDRQGRRDSTWVTERTIGKHCRVCEKTVRNAIRYLESVGLIRETKLIKYDPLKGAELERARNRYYLADPEDLFGPIVKGADWDDFDALLKNFSPPERKNISGKHQQDSSKGGRQYFSKSVRQDSSNSVRQDVADKLYSSIKLDSLEELDSSELNPLSQKSERDSISSQEIFLNHKTEEIVTLIYKVFKKQIDIYRRSADIRFDKKYQSKWLAFIVALETFRLHTFKGYPEVPDLMDFALAIVSHTIIQWDQIIVDYPAMNGAIGPNLFKGDWLERLIEAAKWAGFFGKEFQEAVGLIKSSNELDSLYQTYKTSNNQAHSQSIESNEINMRN